MKGYGLLIISGDLLVSTDKLEWSGLIMVGGTISTVGDAHLHVKGAAMAGLSCSESDIAAGNCRSSLMGDHNDMKYRPCEVNQAWGRIMTLEAMDDLFREASPNN